MSGTLKKVRFKLAWQTYRVGDVIEPNGTLRDWLLAHGYVELLQQTPAAAIHKGNAKRPLVQRVKNVLTRAAGE